MGLCSYLLIGFWYQLEAPRKASQKAFLTTRVGDLGFLFALLVIYKAIGTWEIHDVLTSIPTWAPGVATAAAIGLLVAAMGKSAQVPLHVWLPDAMAGPTPASALIHAATMVAAGVYLVARMMPIFEAAPAVLQATLIIGAVTAIIGGLLAAVQHDIKKVLAYSTISQLGLMFMALGAASVGAALFHLVTHAFFKSLLFLGAGVIIHSAKTQDMREMGGLRRHMPVTWATFLIGSLALAGVMPFSGFFSKDEILAVLLHEPQLLGVRRRDRRLAHHRVLHDAPVLPRLRGSRAERAPPRGPHLDGRADGGARRHDVRDRLRLGPLRRVPRPRRRVAVAAAHRDLGRRGGGRHRQRLVGLRPALGRRQHARLQGPDGPRLRRRCKQKLYFDVAYEYLFIKPFIYWSGRLGVFDNRVIDGAVNGVSRAGSSRVPRAGSSTAASSTARSTASRRSLGARAPTCASCNPDGSRATSAWCSRRSSL